MIFCEVRPVFEVRTGQRNVLSQFYLFKRSENFVLTTNAEKVLVKGKVVQRFDQF